MKALVELLLSSYSVFVVVVLLFSSFLVLGALSRVLIKRVFWSSLCFLCLFKDV